MNVKDYTAAIESLHRRAGELTARRKFDLDHMRVLLSELGDPQHRFPSVLIAGTNGKGSTSATLAAIGMASGLRTGLYTSPHLSRVNERLQINGVEIADEVFAQLYFRVDDAAEELVRRAALPFPPSFFEVLTAMAFCWFAEQRVELAVLEVGLGGRLDATNVVEPILSVITDIGLDHQEWLGDTLAEITHEKAGILRRGGTMVTLPQHPEVNQALGEAAMPLHVNGISAAEYVPPYEGPQFRNHYPLAVLGKEIAIESPLNGEFQRRNIALAIASAVELRTRGFLAITPQSIEAGIRNTRWPGRLELLRDGRVLLDVAHNPAGAWALRSALSAWESEGGVELDGATLVFACLRDKPAVEMAQILFPLFRTVIATEVNSPRGLPAVELAEQTRTFARELLLVENPAAAVEQAEANGVVVVAGSVYLVGEVRSALTG